MLGTVLLNTALVSFAALLVLLNYTALVQRGYLAHWRWGSTWHCKLFGLHISCKKVR